LSTKVVAKAGMYIETSTRIRHQQQFRSDVHP